MGQIPVDEKEVLELIRYLNNSKNMVERILAALRDHHRLKRELEVAGQEKSILVRKVERLHEDLNYQNCQKKKYALGRKRTLELELSEGIELDHWNTNLFLRTDDLMLDPNVRKKIKVHGITRVWQLVEYEEKNLLRWKRFGRISLKKVKDTLEDLCLSLGMKLHDFPLTEVA